jgi:hypothetical protein
MRFGIAHMIFAVAIVLLAKPPLYAFLVVGLIVSARSLYDTPSEWRHSTVTSENRVFGGTHRLSNHAR